MTVLACNSYPLVPSLQAEQALASLQIEVQQLSQVKGEAATLQARLALAQAQAQQQVRPLIDVSVCVWHEIRFGAKCS